MNANNLAVALALLTLPACTVAVEDEEYLGEADRALMIGRPHEYWTLGDTVHSHTWDSGITSNLSGWKGAFCSSSFGRHYVLEQLEVAREPRKYLDNWAAKMQAHCQQYIYSGRFATDRTAMDRQVVDVFSVSHRTPDYPTGMWLDDYSGWVEEVGMLPIGINLDVGDLRPGTSINYGNVDGGIDIDSRYRHVTNVTMRFGRPRPVGSGPQHDRLRNGTPTRPSPIAYNKRTELIMCGEGLVPGWLAPQARRRQRQDQEAADQLPTVAVRGGPMSFRRLVEDRSVVHAAAGSARAVFACAISSTSSRRQTAPARTRDVAWRSDDAGGSRVLRRAQATGAHGRGRSGRRAPAARTRRLPSRLHFADGPTAMSRGQPDAPPLARAQLPECTVGRGPCVLVAGHGQQRGRAIAEERDRVHRPIQ